MTGKRLDASALGFSWTYSNRADSDTFLWQYADGSQHGTTNTPALRVNSTGSAQICVQVKVVRADGTNAALVWSDPGCAT